MQVQVSGQHISIGASLEEYVKERVTLIVNKYFDQAIKANIHFAKDSFLKKCEILVNEGTGRNILLKSTHECDDIYSSFDQALAKLEKQLRKYKSKIKDHHKTKLSDAVAEGTKYIISPHTEEDHLQENPVTIAEKPYHVDNLSVAEAIMRMDLESLPALMFKNKQNNRMNMVYYRKDGNIAWVDSK